MTLALGIVLSMFTSLVISRLLVNALYAVGFKAEKFYGRQKERKAIDFVGKTENLLHDFYYFDSAGALVMGIFQQKYWKSPEIQSGFMGATSTQ